MEASGAWGFMTTITTQLLMKTTAYSPAQGKAG
jgi:hypothetical protein